MQVKHIQANGLEFGYFEQGEGPLVLCLHGFPDSAHTFEHLLERLAGAGFRAVAPFMRGYSPTSVPADGDYAVPTLGRDALALAEALGEDRFSIIGHDWGATAAYAAAGLAPERVQKIVTAAVPHLRQFLGRMNAVQLRRSWYMGFFQLPVLPERRIGRNGLAFIDKLWRDWSPGWNYSDKDIAPVKAILEQPECRKAALGYYRALLPNLLDPRRREERKKILARTRVPTLAIAGRDDGCIGVEMFEGQERFFSGPYNLITLKNAGHFMHRERPRAFAEAAIHFLND